MILFTTHTLVTEILKKLMRTIINYLLERILCLSVNGEGAQDRSTEHYYTAFHPFPAQSILPQSRIGNIYCIGSLYFIVGALHRSGVRGLGGIIFKFPVPTPPTNRGVPSGCGWGTTFAVQYTQYTVHRTPYTEAGSGTLHFTAGILDTGVD